MRMKLSKEKCLLHISTIALSGLLFTNMPGVINAAENNDVSNEQSAEQSALVQSSNTSSSHDGLPNPSSEPLVADASENQSDSSHASHSQTKTTSASGTDAKEFNQATATKYQANQQQAVQTSENQKPAATSKDQARQDANAEHQSESASYNNLPETGHVDHPESGAVIAIIIGIVISTIALIRVRRQNS